MQLMTIKNNKNGVLSDDVALKHEIILTTRDTARHVVFARRDVAKGEGLRATCEPFACLADVSLLTTSFAPPHPSKHITCCS